MARVVRRLVGLVPKMLRARVSNLGWGLGVQGFGFKI